MKNRAMTIIIASIVTVGFAVLPAMAATGSSTTTALTSSATTTTPSDWYNPGWD